MLNMQNELSIPGDSWSLVKSSQSCLENVAKSEKLSQYDSNYTATPLLAQPPGPLQAQNQSPQANHTQTDMAQKVAA